MNYLRSALHPGWHPVSSIHSSFLYQWVSLLKLNCDSLTQESKCETTKSPNETRACMLSRFSHVWLFEMLLTVAFRAPLSIGFSRQEYWSGLTYLLQGIFPAQGWNQCLLSLLHWQAGFVLFCFLLLVPSGKPPDEPKINLKDNSLSLNTDTEGLKWVMMSFYDKKITTISTLMVCL